MGEWDALVASLLSLDLASDVYDVVVDILHGLAEMPCECVECAGRLSAAERAIAAKPAKPTVDGDRMKYDQNGRYRIRYR